MQGVDAVAQALKVEGVEHLFCFPANTLIDAAAAIGIRPILARSEKTLVNVADGYTRATNARRTGVCVVQHGPGVENAFGAVAQAYSDSVPLLVLPGGPNQHRLGVPTGFDPLPSYRHITKWAARINFVDRVPEMLRRAFTQLRTGRPAPVLLELPQDVAAAELPDDLDYRPVRGYRSAGDPEDVAAAARALLAARRPVLHVGHGALWAQAWDELRELAELVGAPVMTTMAAKSVFSEDHPLSLGTSGHTITAAAAHFLKKADLVFGVGCSFSKGSFSTTIPAGKTMVQVTVDERDLNKEYPIDHAVVGDAKLVLGQLIEEVRRQAGPDGRRGDDAAVRREIREVKEAWLEEWLPRLTSTETPINPYRVIWDLAHTVDRAETIVTHDSGNPRDQMLTFYDAVAPRGYLGWGKSTQLGTSLGMAMGAKLAEPGKLVVNVMGDLAFGMAGMDVETAVRERIPTLTIILNNSCLGGYGHHMPRASERYRTNQLSGDYTRVAEGLGAYAERVERPDEVAPAIRRAIRQTAEGRPAVLEMITKEEPVFSQY